MTSLLVTIGAHLLFALVSVVSPSSRVAVAWNVTNLVGSSSCVHYTACVSIDDAKGCTAPERCK